ncbi:unnamed protein product [Amoebophrya sp. A120]|nr:unnamed protein product [Amoebophrya sp. A120]|eukprot:GSA120T00004706001.1
MPLGGRGSDEKEAGRKLREALTSGAADREARVKHAWQEYWSVFMSKSENTTGGTGFDTTSNKEVLKNKLLNEVLDRQKLPDSVRQRLTEFMGATSGGGSIVKFLFSTQPRRPDESQTPSKGRRAVPTQQVTNTNANPPDTPDYGGLYTPESWIESYRQLCIAKNLETLISEMMNNTYYKSIIGLGGKKAFQGTRGKNLFSKNGTDLRDALAGKIGVANAAPGFAVKGVTTSPEAIAADQHVIDHDDESLNWLIKSGFATSNDGNENALFDAVANAGDRLLGIARASERDLVNYNDKLIRKQIVNKIIEQGSNMKISSSQQRGSNRDQLEATISHHISEHIKGYAVKFSDNARDRWRRHQRAHNDGGNVFVHFKTLLELPFPSYNSSTSRLSTEAAKFVYGALNKKFQTNKKVTRVLFLEAAPDDNKVASIDPDMLKRHLRNTQAMYEYEDHEKWRKQKLLEEEQAEIKRRKQEKQAERNRREQKLREEEEAEIKRLREEEEAEEQAEIKRRRQAEIERLREIRPKRLRDEEEQAKQIKRSRQARGRGPRTVQGHSTALQITGSEQAGAEHALMLKPAQGFQAYLEYAKQSVELPIGLVCVALLAFVLYRWTPCVRRRFSQLLPAKPRATTKSTCCACGRDGEDKTGNTEDEVQDEFKATTAGRKSRKKRNERKKHLQRRVQSGNEDDCKSVPARDQALLPLHIGKKKAKKPFVIVSFPEDLCENQLGDHAAEPVQPASFARTEADHENHTGSTGQQAKLAVVDVDVEKGRGQVPEAKEPAYSRTASDCTSEDESSDSCSSSASPDHITDIASAAPDTDQEDWEKPAVCPAAPSKRETEEQTPLLRNE